ncbi:MAG: YceI family protein [Bacteroidales bacterium]|nr:YceI family protein [Bacteroidales bacterium]
MRIRILLVISLCIATANLYAQKGSFIVRKSLVKFQSDAPLEVISAESTQLQGQLDPGKRSFSFVIPSTSFKGFNSPLQQVHFYENYIEAQKYPESRFNGKIIEQIDFTADGEYTIRAKGMLFIHGVEQERILKVKLKMKNGVLTATSDFSVMLQEHNINIPRVVYQKIAEEIFVKVNLEMVRK